MESKWATKVIKIQPKGDMHMCTNFMIIVVFSWDILLKNTNVNLMVALEEKPPKDSSSGKHECVQNVVPSIEVDVEIFIKLSETFDLLLAWKEMSGSH